MADNHYQNPNDENQEDLEEEDPYSPTSWDKDPYESDEDYQDRIQDQEDWLEYNS